MDWLRVLLFYWSRVFHCGVFWDSVSGRRENGKIYMLDLDGITWILGWFVSRQLVLSRDTESHRLWLDRSFFSFTSSLLVDKRMTAHLTFTFFSCTSNLQFTLHILLQKATLIESIRLNTASLSPFSFSTVLYSSKSTPTPTPSTSFQVPQPPPSPAKWLRTRLFQPSCNTS